MVVTKRLIEHPQKSYKISAALLEALLHHRIQSSYLSGLKILCDKRRRESPSSGYGKAFEFIQNADEQRPNLRITKPKLDKARPSKQTPHLDPSSEKVRLLASSAAVQRWKMMTMMLLKWHRPRSSPKSSSISQMTLIRVMRRQGTRPSMAATMTMTCTTTAIEIVLRRGEGEYRGEASMVKEVFQGQSIELQHAAEAQSPAPVSRKP